MIGRNVDTLSGPSRLTLSVKYERCDETTSAAGARRVVLAHACEAAPHRATASPIPRGDEDRMTSREKPGGSAGM